MSPRSASIAAWASARMALFFCDRRCSSRARLVRARRRCCSRVCEGGRRGARDYAGAHGARLDPALGERGGDQRRLERAARRRASARRRVRSAAARGEALLRGGGGGFGFVRGGVRLRPGACRARVLRGARRRLARAAARRAAPRRGDRVRLARRRASAFGRPPVPEAARAPLPRTRPGRGRVLRLVPFHHHHIVRRSSVPVIRSSAQYGHSPVNLLGNHHPNEPMRPSLSAKSELFVSVILNAL